MNTPMIAEALMYVDDDLLTGAFNCTEKVRSPKMHWKYLGIAACLVLVITVIAFAGKITSNIPKQDNMEQTGKPSENQPTQNVEPNVEWGFYVNSKLYFPDAELSNSATEENVGEFVGYISYGNESVTDIRVFEFLPDDGVTNRVIVPYDGLYYVYSFYMYIPDGTDNWPANLFENAAYIEIRDPNYGVFNETVYLTISEANEISDLLTFLAHLNQKHTQKEINQYEFDLFYDQFKEGEIWIDEDGGIAHGGNIDVSMKFSELVYGDCRDIAIIMKDNTGLTYVYKEGAGVLHCDDFGYILTDEQVEQINRLIGLT